jgi:hypothetical protein
MMSYLGARRTTWRFLDNPRDALTGIRVKAQENVTAEHVHLHEGGQTIVGRFVVPAAVCGKLGQPPETIGGCQVFGHESVIEPR